jgi:hypothetical protein
VSDGSTSWAGGRASRITSYAGIVFANIVHVCIQDFMLSSRAHFLFAEILGLSARDLERSCPTSLIVLPKRAGNGWGPFKSIKHTLTQTPRVCARRRKQVLNVHTHRVGVCCRLLVFQ